MSCHYVCISFFFFNDTATTEIYTLSLHDALPISVTGKWMAWPMSGGRLTDCQVPSLGMHQREPRANKFAHRSEEHTSELQSRQYLVCRLLLEKKKKIDNYIMYSYELN